jgi:hypothetical protein
MDKSIDRHTNASVLGPELLQNPDLNVLVPCAPTDMKYVLYSHAYRYNECSHHEVIIESNMANIDNATI